MLFIGDSGSGKTGALASLAEAGYNLRILDFDNGLDILANLLSPEAQERVTFVTLTDKMKTAGGIAVPAGVPKAYTSALKLCNNWETEDEQLGPITSWGENDILVVDSFTFMSNATFRYVDMVNSFKDGRQTYGETQRLLENFLGLLYSDAVKCNVIVTSHISYIDIDENLTKGYPASAGKALSPRIPRYFNTMLECKTRGTGAKSKHVILTQPSGVIELKNPSKPGTLPRELPIETGLADFFKLIRA
jgi:hypothetical protein